MEHFQPKQTPADLPISKLPPELLLRIFTLSAVMDPESDNEMPALDTLRHTSQVCAFWRNILLEFPTLWGSVLNMVIMNRSPRWREEVMRRTGRAQISVMATHRDIVGQVFVLQFASQHWSRMRSIDVKTREDPITFSEYKIWSSFIQRSSGLLHLTIHGSQSVIFDFLKSIARETFPQLRTLELDESFSLLNAGAMHEVFSFSPASLPHLRAIKLVSTMQVNGMIQFLNSIVPAEGCILEFIGSAFFNSTQKRAIDAISSVLPRYLVYNAGRGRSSVGPIAKVKFTTSCIEFSTSFGALTSSEEPSTFRFSIHDAASELSSRATLPEYAISTLASCLDPFPLENIRTLSLRVAPPRFLDDSVNSAIEEFMLRLTSVEDLEADDFTLVYLDNLQRQTATIILPALRTITIDEKVLQFVRGFLDLRLKMGMQAENLTLTVISDRTVDVSMLDGFTGLTVRIDQEEISTNA